MLTELQKKFLLIFGGGLVLFMLVKPRIKKKGFNQVNHADKEDAPSKRTKMKAPVINPKDLKGNKEVANAFGALKAYIDAYNNNEPQSVLDDLNKEFGREFSLKVYRRKSDNKLVVCNLEGKDILVNN